MKYNFKPDLAFKNLDVGLRRFMNEEAPGYKLIIPVTTDPCSVVAAWTIWKIVPDLFEVVYFKQDDFHTDEMEEVVQLMMGNFRDHFTIIDMGKDYPTFGKFYGELLGNHGIITLCLQFDAREAFLLSKYREINPLVVSSLDAERDMYGIGESAKSIVIFDGMILQEIFEIGEFLGIDKKLLESLKDKSEEIKLFHDTLGYNLIDESLIFRKVKNPKDLFTYLNDRYGIDFLKLEKQFSFPSSKYLAYTPFRSFYDYSDDEENENS